MMSFPEKTSMLFELDDHKIVVNDIPARRRGDSIQMSLQSRKEAEHLVANHILNHQGLRGPQALKFCRKVLGLGAVLFAQLCGVDKSSLSRWENGHTPTPEAAWNLLALLASQDSPKEVAQQLVTQKGGEGEAVLSLAS
jgi:DNA-binding transcriptional regulator YiaG